jgi:hypothetical protein
MKCLLAVLVLLIVVIAGCTAPGGGGTPPTPNTTYSPTELKYLLLDHYNESRFFYCDPDYYPVSHGDEQAKAIAAFPVIKSNREEFDAIVARKDLHPPFSDESKLIVYREYKKLNAIPLTPMADDTYSFSLQLETSEGGRRVSGIIRTDGVILEEEFEDAFLTCPICLARGTCIDTPDGHVAVDELEPGMSVWTRDANGSKSAVLVVQTIKTRVPPAHRVIHLGLSDGREVDGSPGHPTTDDRTLGILHPGDLLDGAMVTGADPIPYTGEYTYDILPAGETGIYWANGIPLKSTLFLKSGS